MKKQITNGIKQTLEFCDYLEISKKIAIKNHRGEIEYFLVEAPEEAMFVTKFKSGEVKRGADLVVIATKRVNKSRGAKVITSILKYIEPKQFDIEDFLAIEQ
jgi:hypothetical protein